MFKMVTWPHFEIIVIVVIGLHVIAMTMPYYGMSTRYEFAMTVMIQIFSVLFVIEAFVKILGLGFS